MHVDTQRHFLISIAVAIALTGISYLVGLNAGWIVELNWLEVAAVATSYSCTYLCVMQSRWNYPIGALSTTLLCILFWQTGLLAQSALNAYLPFALLYGWWRWGSDRSTRPVKHVSMNMLPVYAAVTAVTWAFTAAVANYFGGVMAPLESVILVGSIFAQFLLDNKRIETWAVWAIVNVVAIYVNWQAGLYLVAFQFVFFLGNTVWGYLAWRETMRQQDTIARIMDRAYPKATR